MTPAGWTYDIQSPAVEFGYGFDSDVTDRETRILDITSRSDRNLWQSFTPKQQAFTPDAEALAMTIERGAISDRADVELVLEPTSPEALANDQLRECVLTFDATQLQTALAEGDEGHLAADPVDAGFDARSETCAHFETGWKEPGATADDRREVLAQTRIVEFSLWYWNHADEPTVIDDVHLTGARLVAEEHAPVSV